MIAFFLLSFDLIKSFADGPYYDGAHFITANLCQQIDEQYKLNRETGDCTRCLANTRAITATYYTRHDTIGRKKKKKKKINANG